MQSNDELSVVTSLAAKYPLFAPATIERWVRQTAGQYTSATIQTYVPVLVERTVDATLHELAREEGTSSDVLTLDPGDPADPGDSPDPAGQTAVAASGGA